MSGNWETPALLLWNLDYINTSKNLADQFTKGLSQNMTNNASMELGLRPIRVSP
jgi:hypothetical protein